MTLLETIIKLLMLSTGLLIVICIMGQLLLYAYKIVQVIFS